MKTSAFAYLGIFCAGLGACSELPTDGPRHQDILAGATTAMVNVPGTVAIDYALVDLNQNVVAHAIDVDPGSFFKTYAATRGPAPEIRVGVGDVLTVTIFESKSGGLFIPADSGTRPGNYVSLPPQSVDFRGNISVPYAGVIDAAGRSISAIQTDIERRLANRAIEPKVIVSFVEQNSTAVSVVGEVNLPKKARIPQNGARVLDAIADAGGIKWPGYETYVTLQRRGKKSTVYFNTLVKNPEENVFVYPGDTLYVYREPRRFVAYGALNSFGPLGATGEFAFNAEHVSLAEGVGRAGGLTDTQANPGQVFLYRVESRKVLCDMGVDVSQFPPEQEAIPTVYRANFRDPSGYFYAQKFPMRGKDILYVSNAEAVEVTKFLAFLRIVTSTGGGVAQDGALARQGIRYLSTGNAPAL
jgi:polysaccharide biosynthesis/export protein